MACHEYCWVEDEERNNICAWVILMALGQAKPAKRFKINISLIAITDTPQTPNCPPSQNNHHTYKEYPCIFLSSLPADVRWGSFVTVTHSFLRRGEMNA